MSECIVTKIGKKFRTFGGGQGSRFNPITEALKDKPYQFAGGVDVAEVVAAVLEESGHDTLTKQRDNLLAACRENYLFTLYAAAVKKENTDDYLKEFFRLGESAQKAAKSAIAAVKTKENEHED